MRYIGLKSAFLAAGLTLLLAAALKLTLPDRPAATPPSGSMLPEAGGRVASAFTHQPAPVRAALAILNGTQEEAQALQDLRPPRGYRPTPYSLRGPDGPHDFYFTRAIYSSYGGRRRASWATDFPKADRQFLWGLRRLTNIDAYEAENAVGLTDPALRRFPFLYALEVGYMTLSPPEAEALRSYLLAGGFLMIDDFWGTRQWQNFEYEIRRVLPEFEIVELPMDHPLFRTFYEIDEILQVPQVGYAWYGGVTWERDGYVPRVLGIFDDEGRLLVAINWNTDLGDAWEWAEDPFYPLPLSTFAYQLAVNTIVYAMTH